ncbi:MAG: hypothetical protein ACLU0O_00870 [Collinsella sp.]
MPTQHAVNVALTRSCKAPITTAKPPQRDRHRCGGFCFYDTARGESDGLYPVLDLHFGVALDARGDGFPMGAAHVP